MREEEGTSGGEGHVEGGERLAQSRRRRRNRVEEKRDPPRLPSLLYRTALF
jgi:hypothetical protein